MSGCKLPWSAILVEVDGTVKCCCFQKIPLGNLNEDTLEDIWNGSMFVALRAAISSGDYKTFCLSDCPHVPKG